MDAGIALPRQLIFEINAKGKTASGHINVDYRAAATGTFLLEVLLDGVIYGYTSSVQDLNYNITDNDQSLLQLKQADQGADFWSYIFGKDWTFGYQFGLYITNFDGNILDVTGLFNYYLYR